MREPAHSEFVLESREHLQVFERSMLALEKATGAQISQLIDTSLRAVHSLKGNAGFLGFHIVQKLAHATETVLEKYRDSGTSPSGQTVEVLLLAIDRLATLIEDLDHSNSADISPILVRLIATGSSQATPQQSMNIKLPLESWSADLTDLHATLESLGIVQKLNVANCHFEQPIETWVSTAPEFHCNLVTQQSIFAIHQRLETAGHPVLWSGLGVCDISDWTTHELSYLEQASAAGLRLIYEPNDFEQGVPRKPVLLQSSGMLPSLNPSAPATTPAPQNKPLWTKPDREIPQSPAEEFGLPSQPAISRSSDQVSSLRIQVEVLDRLMNLVGELTLVRNQSLLAFGEVDGSPRAIIQRLNSVTTELQDAVLKTRMQPVGNLFGRFPRMVRDLGRQLGKQVELVMVGQEVELDKTVLEQLSDPLTHLIRNSVDHGLESPEDRVKSGKPPVGQVTLSATAADGQVIIAIRDDGRGIDPQAVRAKLVSLGLKSSAELQKISNKELYSYILLPGFSTAKQVSDVSGRGVGMDVVKTNVERLEGSLTIDSSPGLGTCMTLRVPLTLAIIPCLIVTVGDERFAVPQRGLEEIVCLHPGGRGALEHSYDSELYRLRDILLPVVRLREVLKRQKAFNASTKAEIIANNVPKDRDPNLIEYILVLRTGGRKFGLLVDDVRGTEEVVVKPMHPSLKKIGIFAGATLMGDGKVALIANIDGIAEHADCYGVEPPDNSGALERDPAEVHRILLFEYGPKEQFALPLVQVRRIESISMARVEQVGDQSYITIDGKAIRIVRLDRYLNVTACQESADMHLLLPKFINEPMGILVSRIVDTDTLAIDLQEASLEDPGILGTAIVRGKLSLFIDTQFLRERLFGSQDSHQHFSLTRLTSSPPIAHHSNSSSAKKPVSTSKRVLLVDDTPFFREVVKRYFERIGVVVTTAVDGVDGLRHLRNDTFDLVVSDIEMPNMDGWEFCLAARRQGFRTPFLALTSLSKIENAEKASQCGFDRFEEKLDHDRLIASVRELLGMETNNGGTS